MISKSHTKNNSVSVRKYTSIWFCIIPLHAVPLGLEFRLARKWWYKSSERYSFNKMDGVICSVKPDTLVAMKELEVPDQFRPYMVSGFSVMGWTDCIDCI